MNHCESLSVHRSIWPKQAKTGPKPGQNPYMTCTVAQDRSEGVKRVNPGVDPQILYWDTGLTEEPPPWDPLGPLPDPPPRPPQTPDPVLGLRLLAISSVILAPRGPWGVIQGSKMTHFGGPFLTPFGPYGQ